jgi:hypothetical protein
MFGTKNGPLKIANIGAQATAVKILLPQRPKKVLFNYNFDVLARETTLSEY